MKKIIDILVIIVLLGFSVVEFFCENRSAGAGFLVATFFAIEIYCYKFLVKTKN